MRPFHLSERLVAGILQEPILCSLQSTMRHFTDLPMVPDIAHVASVTCTVIITPEAVTEVIKLSVRLPNAAAGPAHYLRAQC